MISETGFLFLITFSTVIFLTGVLSSKPLFTFLSGGLFIICTFMSGNVGDGEKLFLDYIYFGYITVMFSFIAFLIGIIGFMSGD